jgi:hypothetical protein
VAESYAAVAGTDATGGDVTANATSLPPSTWRSSDFLIFFFVSLWTKIDFPERNPGATARLQATANVEGSVQNVAPIAIVEAKGEYEKNNRIRHGSLKGKNKTRKVEE